MGKGKGQEGKKKKSKKGIAFDVKRGNVRMK